MSNGSGFAPARPRRGRTGLGAALLVVSVVAPLVAGPPGSAATRNAARSASSLPPVGYSQGPSIPGTFSPRWDFSYAYFPPADQLVVFGGAPVDNSTVWRGDTWLFTGGTWVQAPAPPSGLTPRGGAAMAYDPDIGKVVLFGGEARAADGTGVWPP